MTVPALATAPSQSLGDTDAERSRARCAELLAQLRPTVASPAPDAQTVVRAAFEELIAIPQDCICAELVESLFLIANFYYLAAQSSLGSGRAFETVGQPRSLEDPKVPGPALSNGLHAAARALDYSQALGDKHLIRRALSVKGVMLNETGNRPGATEVYAEAIKVARALNDPTAEAPVWVNLGTALLTSAQYSDAMECFVRAESLARSADPQRAAATEAVESLALANISTCALHLRDVRRGVRAARRAIELNPDPSTAHDCFIRVVAETNYSRLLLDIGELTHAAEHCESARTYANRYPTARSEYTVSVIAGLVDVYSNRTDIGLTRLKDALEHARRNVRSEVRDALQACIAGHEVAGQPDAALLYLHELMALNREGRAARLLAPFETLASELGSDDLSDRLLDQVLTGQAIDLTGSIDKCIGDLVTSAVDNALRAGHHALRIFRVGRLAQLFARSLGWTEASSGELAFAVRLMDVGAVVVPDELLLKPRGLSAGERKLVAEHTGYGADLLRQARLALLQPCVPVSKFHHERWDGDGPWSLAGEAIPIEARIAALADTLDALTHARPWRPAKSIQAALDEIAADAGHHFDPVMAERFVEFVKAEYWRCHDWDEYLSADAQDNAYVRARAQFDRLIKLDV